MPRNELHWNSDAGGGLPINKEFWAGFAIYFPNWVESSPSVLLTQWHQGGPTVNPLFMMRVNGNKLVTEIRHNGSANPTQSGNTTHVQEMASGLPHGVWHYFVINAKISHNPANKPFVHIWRNGTQILNYNAPIGFNSTGYTPFMKIGFYPVGGASGQNGREMLVKRLAYTIDESYSEADIRSFLATAR